MSEEISDFLSDTKYSQRKRGLLHFSLHFLLPWLQIQGYQVKKKMLKIEGNVEAINFSEQGTF